MPSTRESWTYNSTVSYQAEKVRSKKEEIQAIGNKNGVTITFLEEGEKIQPEFMEGDSRNSRANMHTYVRSGKMGILVRSADQGAINATLSDICRLLR